MAIEQILLSLAKLAASQIIPEIPIKIARRKISLQASKSKRRNDGSHARWIYSGDFTGNTGKYATVAQVQDFKALVQGYLTAEDNEGLKIDLLTHTIYLHCSEPFTFQPFLCFSESGTELSNFESTTSTICDPGQIVAESFAANTPKDHLVIPFEVIEPRIVVSGGSSDFVAQITYDLTTFVSKYADGISVGEITNEEIPELSLSAVMVPMSVPQTVYVRNITDAVVHKVKRNFGF